MRGPPPLGSPSDDLESGAYSTSPASNAATLASMSASRDPLDRLAATELVAADCDFKNLRDTLGFPNRETNVALSVSRFERIQQTGQVVRGADHIGCRSDIIRIDHSQLWRQQCHTKITSNVHRRVELELTDLSSVQGEGLGARLIEWILPTISFEAELQPVTNTGRAFHFRRVTITAAGNTHYHGSDGEPFEEPRQSQTPPLCCGFRRKSAALARLVAASRTWRNPDSPRTKLPSQSRNMLSTHQDMSARHKRTPTTNRSTEVKMVFQSTTAVGAVDVHYNHSGGATAALVVYGELVLSTAIAEHVAQIVDVPLYEPGALFKRELPCIEAVLALSMPLRLLIVDGYATLDPDGRPGLGAHAAEAFGLPVIGVAKTRFRAATHAREVIRGTASRPLYVTAAGGVGIDEAARIVERMSGSHRIPSALARVDRLSRSRASTSSSN